MRRGGRRARVGVRIRGHTVRVPQQRSRLLRNLYGEIVGCIVVVTAAAVVTAAVRVRDSFFTRTLQIKITKLVLSQDQVPDRISIEQVRCVNSLIDRAHLEREIASVRGQARFHLSSYLVITTARSLRDQHSRDAVKHLRTQIAGREKARSNIKQKPFRARSQITRCKYLNA